MDVLRPKAGRAGEDHAAGGEAGDEGKGVDVVDLAGGPNAASAAVRCMWLRRARPWPGASCGPSGPARTPTTTASTFG